MFTTRTSHTYYAPWGLWRRWCSSKMDDGCFLYNWIVTPNISTPVLDIPIILDSFESRELAPCRFWDRNRAHFEERSVPFWGIVFAKDPTPSFMRKEIVGLWANYVESAPFPPHLTQAIGLWNSKMRQSFPRLVFVEQLSSHFCPFSGRTAKLFIHFSCNALGKKTASKLWERVRADIGMVSTVYSCQNCSPRQLIQYFHAYAANENFSSFELRRFVFNSGTV